MNYEKYAGSTADYSGEWIDPMPADPELVATPYNAEWRETHNQSWNNIAHWKIWNLFQHYGIDLKMPSLWRELALHLAFAHVPALSVKKDGRGRPPNYSAMPSRFTSRCRLLEISHELEAVELKISDRKIAAIAKKRLKDVGDELGSMSLDTVRRELKKARAEEIGMKEALVTALLSGADLPGDDTVPANPSEEMKKLLGKK